MTVFPFTAAQAKPHTQRGRHKSGSEFLYNLVGIIRRFPLPPQRYPLAPAPSLTSDLPNPTSCPQGNNSWLRALGSWQSAQHLWCPDRRSLPVMQTSSFPAFPNASERPEACPEASVQDLKRKRLGGNCGKPACPLDRHTDPGPVVLAPLRWTFSPLSHSPYKNEAAAIFI